MANEPPYNIVQLIAKLRAMSEGVENWKKAGKPWGGPTPEQIDAITDKLEQENSDTDASYAAYKQNKSNRDNTRRHEAFPLYRSVILAAYLSMGKTSDSLRTLGLEPQAAAEATTMPEPPDGVDVRDVTETSILVDWDPVPDAERYHVYYGTSLEAMQLFGSATRSELTITGLSPNTKYFIYVTSINTAGESKPSNFTTRNTL